MPAALIRRVVLCVLIAAPALVLRFTGLSFAPVIEMVVFGAAVVAAAFLLAWAAEAAQKDISGALAIALLALIAVLPEYAVDLYYAFRSGSDPTYLHYAAANMTGSNRLLLGFGWPLVVLVALFVARRAAARAGTRAPRFLVLPKESRLDIGFLALLAVVAFAIPLLGTIPMWFGIVLVMVFGLYLWRAGQTQDEDDEDEFVGAAALIANMSTRPRRATVISLFVVSAAIILLSAEPFAEALVASGSALGIDSYFLVQWLAPVASEAPEFIIAVMFAARGMGSAAIGTLIASKVNQWSLLVGSLPIAHFAGGGSTALPLDARQIEEFTLTATQTLLGVAIILALRFRWQVAIGLAVLFAVQFAITDTTGRYVLSATQALLAIGFLIAHRREVLPTLAAPFRRAQTAPARTSAGVAS
ncbi:sodium:proton exchanger [Calidifontibacter sp. DB0510]|uniref:Sodium:proton exchanger n=1 Tax=Metallococcus carri TaxID=1656884 RepID=A0A967B1N3_9MICO|nr:sodium:proton exchanger [Metallococcus carri]NHN55858.1 sodium:proton exchanger [Metallococcus carri]NOP38454.1 sodium:proton exchanger [Calidifontibacter sp. DB2511S]